jgi:cation transport ATPase
MPSEAQGHWDRKIFLLSGDLEASTSEVAENLELDGSFGGLLPEEKVGLLEEEQGSGMGKGSRYLSGTA